jgi:hypothetical protein
MSMTASSSFSNGSSVRSAPSVPRLRREALKQCLSSRNTTPLPLRRRPPFPKTGNRQSRALHRPLAHFAPTLASIAQNVLPTNASPLPSPVPAPDLYPPFVIRFAVRSGSSLVAPARQALLPRALASYRSASPSKYRLPYNRPFRRPSLLSRSPASLRAYVFQIRTRPCSNLQRYLLVILVVIILLTDILLLRHPPFEAVFVAPSL